MNMVLTVNIGCSRFPSGNLALSYHASPLFRTTISFLRSSQCDILPSEPRGVLMGMKCSLRILPVCHPPGGHTMAQFWRKITTPCQNWYEIRSTKTKSRPKANWVSKYLYTIMGWRTWKTPFFSGIGWWCVRNWVQENVRGCVVFLYFLFVFVFAKKRLEACPQLGNRRCKRKRHGCSCTCSSTEGYMLLTNHSPPRGLQDQTPLPRNTFPSFCHQHGPRVVDGCIALLGERHLPIILSQALLAVEDAHLGLL